MRQGRSSTPGRRPTAEPITAFETVGAATVRRGNTVRAGHAAAPDRRSRPGSANTSTIAPGTETTSASAVGDGRDALVVSHLKLLPALAHRVAAEYGGLHDPAIDVDDLVSAGAIGLLRAAQTWDPARGASFASWGWRAAAWEMRHALRAGRHQRPANRTHLSLDQALGDSETLLAEVLADDGEQPGDRLEAEVDRLAAKAERMRVLVAVSRLPERERAAVHAYYISGFRQDVAAALLRTTVDAIRCRLVSARRRLAATLTRQEAA